MTLQDKTLQRIDRVSKYRPVSEREYLAAIKAALRGVQDILRDTNVTWTKRRAEEVARELSKTLKPHTTNFLVGFFQDMFSVMMGDTNKMQVDLEGYIDGLFKLDEDMVKNILGFKEILFTSENAKGVITNSMISVDALLKSVEADTIKRVKSQIVSGAITGVNPNEIARQIGRIGGVEARHLRTVVRTMYADAQQRINMESLKLNEEWYDAYEYSAKLDNRTTIICRNLDDRRWATYDDIPSQYHPPLHPNCRSTIIGIVN